MSKSTNPEAVVLGALFDFAGHLRTADIMNPHAGIDGFAKLRKLRAAEVPTMTWREQLDTLRDPAELLPGDSELVTDLLLLAEAFKDGDPGADNKVFDVLSSAVTRLRRPEPAAPATTRTEEDAELFALLMAMGFNAEFQAALDPLMAWAKEIEPDNGVEMRASLIRTKAVAVEHGLWPLKDGAQ